MYYIITVYNNKRQVMISVSHAVVMSALSALSSQAFNGAAINIDSSKVENQKSEEISKLLDNGNIIKQLESSYSIFNDALIYDDKPIKVKTMLLAAYDQSVDSTTTTPTADGSTNCYTNCYVNCHGSRTWR